ncbi:MAG TPA: 16S rRNA (uracil(1498)-N(3))-methyltransferase [Candidatus Eremiobacteraceae bacterium]|nr:16S rRNA (uracil(1498)-N(3))-methyltransferase [Candidatus Eremiobacteraceae bacterium]
MSAPRFFVDTACRPGLEVELHADDAHHATHVLRMHGGDALIVLHGGKAWDATLIEGEAGAVRAHVAKSRDESLGELPVGVSVLQALVKGAKFDDVVEKTVELGARRIVPVHCERSYADASRHRLDRWRRIARSAAQQARRLHVPVIAEPMGWADALQAFRGDARPLVAYENAPAGSFAEALRGIAGARDIAIAIGPEGGLTAAEVEAARAAGCALVSLGPTILRTETAAAAMLAALAAGAGWW